MTTIATKIQVPKVLVETSWINRWQMDASLTIPLPGNKAFGITDRMEGVPHSQILTKVTHLQKQGGIPGVSNDNLWVNLRSEGKSVSEIAASIPDNLKYLVMGQIREDGKSWSDVEAVFQQAYQRLKTVFNLTSPSQTGLIADYWDAQNNNSPDATLPKTQTDPNLARTYSRLRAGMDSQSAARKRWKFEEEFSSEDVAYFSSGAYLNRNWQMPGYLNGLKQTAEGQRAYELIYNLERRYLAIEDRKVCLFAWDSFEGVETPMMQAGDFCRLKFPSGDILRNGLVQVPHSLMKEEVFYALLIGDIYLMWGIFGEYSADIANWLVSRHGEEENQFTSWKTLFQPNGGNVQEFDQGNPAHPTLKTRYPNYNIFPEVPRTGLQGAACGAYLYSQISGYANQSVEYPKYTYSYNGNQVGGYFNGSDPVSGSKGNARASTFGYANYSQHNILRSAEGQKPICHLTRGIQGKAVAWRNCFAKIGEEQVVLVNAGGGEIIECHATGPGLQTFRVPNQS